MTPLVQSGAAPFELEAAASRTASGAACRNDALNGADVVLVYCLLGSAFEVFWFFAFFEPPGRKNAPGSPKGRPKL